ncbi:SDR family NAD(P)-dependent oxidoreductase [Tsukamurella ocularis]|uniref:SDR family NAD(P)-dependent oxidoreductase n=1 Tax=Tsukamurella ocularis TaxID=1970234 RepID=UPI00216A51E7|nr:SDR family oxidoreductase [Tsukamurella ocularis]MCS3780195.1 3-oxoacyl-[acyl-carrier protein] reductase [Tsukamurella ocularis]MCS3786251.1 3-oxoacyl-[acyl-carrier protein] reductase [Tsukamurella ocularis]MCS3849616.1 3-oxoacyl-[acyl-carrier protein] reductase [Tsukamurella ocularis]
MTRRAVVTGGGTGIGRAIAHRLASDGNDVVIVGRRADVLAETASAINAALGAERVSAEVADLADPSAVDGLAGRIGAARTVDVLVNNVGGNPARDGASDDLAGTAEAYATTFRLNVITAVLATEALRPYLTRPGGRIVSISSIAGLRGPGPYGAAKGALHAWSAGLALELAPEGVTVNVVAPGFVPATEFWADRLTTELHDSRIAQIPAGRAGTPEEVAAAVAYLAAPDAGWTTGQILQVNGGTLLGRG